MQLEDLLNTIFSNVEDYENDSSTGITISSLFPYYFSSLDYSDVKVYNEDLIEEFESIVEE